jgi:transcriptional regulator with XRE-family HTH domain
LAIVAMDLREILGRNVRRARQDRGLTIEALADAICRSPSYVGQIERGTRNPSLQVIEALSVCLKVRAHDLLDPQALERPVSANSNGARP